MHDFIEHKDIDSLFPLRLEGYNSIGYKKVFIL